MLPASFYLPDAAGVVCATDAAFMSTSLGVETPVHYMAAAPKPNLLWEIAAAAEDDMGYHVGAEVAMLSQYSNEREVLFPPLTMLRVSPRAGAPAEAPPLPADASPLDRVAASRERLDVTQQVAGDGKEYERVRVVATFTG